MNALIVIRLILLLVPMVTMPSPVSQQEEEASTVSPQRQLALVMLTNLAEEVRSIDGVEQRVRLLASIADLIWPYQPEAAREYIREAFEETVKMPEMRRDETDAPRSRSSFQRELVKVAARHDVQFAHTLITRFIDRPMESSFHQSPSDSGSPHQPYSPYSLASALVDVSPQLAVEVAERGLTTGINWHTLSFLRRLRQKDAEQARAFFISAVDAVYRRRGRNINELFILYSYLFAPKTLIEVTASGPRVIELPAYSLLRRDTSVDPDLARYFLQASADILLAEDRYASPSPEAEMLGDYYFITLLLPQYRMYLPELIDRIGAARSFLEATLKARMNMRLHRLPQETSPSRKDSHPGTGMSSVDVLVDKAERTTDPVARDRQYFRAIAFAVKKHEYDRARDLVSRLSDNTRTSARSFVNFMIASQAVSDHEYHLALHYARHDQDPARRAYILMSVAASLPPTERGWAFELLTKAEMLARKVRSKKIQTSLLFGLASVYARLDPAQGLGMLSKAIESANKMEEFDPDNLTINASIMIGGFGFFYHVDHRYFGFAPVFRSLSKKHFHSTVLLALQLQDRVARAKALIAILHEALAPASPPSGIPSQRTEPNSRRASTDG